MDAALLQDKRAWVVILAVILIFAAFVAVRLYPQSPDIRVFIVGNVSAGSWTETVYPVDGSAPFEIESDILSILQAEDFRIAGVRYLGELRPDFLVPDVLDSADVILLYGAPICDRTARQVIADFVKDGGSLVVVGDACTRVVDTPQIGWSIGQNDFGVMMPAEYVGQEDVDVRLKIYDVDHPLFNGIRNTDVPAPISKIRPNSNATVLAFLNSSDVESGNALYGVLEKPYGKGRVVYFAYDLGRLRTGGSRNLWLNLLLYLDGRR